MKTNVKKSTRVKKSGLTLAAKNKMFEKQVKMGTKVENEHNFTIHFIKEYFKYHGKFPTNKTIYESIALDHILEDKNYYTKLKKARL